MIEKEKKAWVAFKKVIQGFLRNKKDLNYKEIVSNMLDKFKKLRCNMSLKLHFLYNYLDYQCSTFLNVAWEA